MQQRMPSGRPQAALGPGKPDEPSRAKTHAGTVKLLLDRGARIHAGNDDALYWAAWAGHPETVKVLLSHGATITPEIRRMAEQKGNPQIRALLK